MRGEGCWKWTTHIRKGYCYLVIKAMLLDSHMLYKLFETLDKIKCLWENMILDQQIVRKENFLKSNRVNRD